MVDKSNASYLYKKRGVYYFSKQVPCDVKQHYSRDRIVICLRTKTVSIAMRSSQSVLQRLEDYWLSLRLSSMPLPGQHLIKDRPRDYFGSDSPLLTEALAKYLALKGKGKDKTFVRGAYRNINIDIVTILQFFIYQTMTSAKPIILNITDRFCLISHKSILHLV